MATGTPRNKYNIKIKFGFFIKISQIISNNIILRDMPHGLADI